MGFTGALGGCNSCRQPGKLGGVFALDLLSQEGVDQSLEAREQFIRQFDFSPYLEEADPLGVLDRALLTREMQRFFLLSLHDVQFVLRTEQIDKIWHEMILDTPAYINFCRSAFGTYLHHMPPRSDLGLEGAGGDDMLTHYQRLFGETPPTDIWEIQLPTECLT